MAIRKVRMTMPYDTPMVVTKDPNCNKVDPLAIFSLEEFEIVDGNARWVISTTSGKLITGGLGVVNISDIKDYGDISVALAIPVVLHKQKSILAPEFIIMIPERLRVFTLNTLKKKYGTDHNFFL